ncbi:MAG: phosphodiester glycosidase family protein, partial [Chloroflexi bacterium]|nr:phosphodiester glycosidase family protein [Chloroflexota bacterium]
VDLAAAGIDFLVTPDPTPDDRGLPAQTVSQFLDAYNLQVAINGDFFDPWRDFGPLDYYPHTQDLVTVRGLAISDGQIYTRGYSRNFDTVFISANNRVAFNRPNNDDDNAISGTPMIVENGGVAPMRRTGFVLQNHPRTAIAIDALGRTLILIAVDGRQPNYSEGVSLIELAEIAIEYGAHQALNMDGGGSVSLTIAGPGGAPLILNSPIHNRIPGRERPIGNHLGIYALPPE